MRRYALNPATPVLLRPDGACRSAGIRGVRCWCVRRPGVSAVALADLLRTLQSGATLSELQADVSASTPTDLIASLVDAGVVTTVARAACPVGVDPHPWPRTAVGSARRALRCSGARITHSSRTMPAPRPEPTDLVVLSDYLVSDPRVVRDLHAARVPHLPVRVRDGTGLVGPLVIPGVTSCLECADLHRSDRDAAWPAVAAQLRDTVGSADRATVLATAALALNQVDRVIRAVRSGARRASAEPPPTLDTTLEFDVNVGAIVARRWSRHPRCSC